MSVLALGAVSPHLAPRGRSFERASLLSKRRAEQIMVMPAVKRRWTAREQRAVRELLLAAEILSPSSGRFDRVIKREPYQRHAGEYWIVDLDSRVVERWRPNDERPQIVPRGLVWHPAGAAEPFRLDLPWYFAEIFGE